ncbi:MAG: site-specific integrase [Pseudobdellovibrio sp.]
MGIKQEKDGTWSASYSKRHPQWKTPISLYRKKLETKAEAIRAHQELIILVNQKIAEKVAPTWKRCVAGFLEQIRINGYTQKTIYSIETCLRKYSAHLNNRYVDTIKTVEIFEIINQMTCNTVGHKGFILKSLNNVFDHAVNCGYINRNPTPKLKLKAPEKIMPVLTEPQVTILLQQARDLSSEWYPIWAAAVFTGMRSGELFALKKNNINIEDRTILVSESWNSSDGFKCTKSGHDRIVEIAKPLIPIFKELVAASPESEFLLPRLPKWYKGEQARCLRHFLVGIGLPPVRFHDLRATWATMMLAKGVAPAKVMSIGGWRDMETMMIYMRKAGLDIKGATDCLDNVFNPAVSTAKVVSFHR